MPPPMSAPAIGSPSKAAVSPAPATAPTALVARTRCSRGPQAVRPRQKRAIRRSESVKRATRYKEPQICRFYGSKKNRVSVFLPILEWTNKDVKEFINERGIKCHPLYYDEQGNFHVERRLGCIGCPLKSDRGLADFKANPRFLKAYLRAGKKWWDSHPNVASVRNFRTVYDLFVHNVFFDSYADFRRGVGLDGLFEPVDCKKFLEDYFGIELE